MTLQNTEADVKIENLTSEPFSVSSGVRQGDPLSATIFNIILDSEIKKLNLRIQFNSIYCLPYILYKHITDLETVLANINMHINDNKH